MAAPPPPSSAPASVVVPAQTPHRESFAKFFEHWLGEQRRDLDALTSTLTTSNSNESQLRHLGDRVLGHYEQYYKTKSVSAGQDILPMFSPSWTSKTENLFLWAGGWRPTAAFHLLYSKSGIELEAGLEQILQGRAVTHLGGLSATQLQQVDELQRQTVCKERVISEKSATAQEAVAGADMVEVSHMLATASDGARADGEMEREMREKEEEMREVLEEADGLRLETLKAVVRLLSPLQAAHFLIAAAELHLALHSYGNRKDAAAAAANGGAEDHMSP